MTLNPRALSDILDAVAAGESASGRLPAASRPLRPRRRPAAETVPAETGLRITVSARWYEDAHGVLVALGKRLAWLVDQQTATTPRTHIRESDDGRAWVLAVRWADADGATVRAAWVDALGAEAQALLPDARVELCRWEGEA